MHNCHIIRIIVLLGFVFCEKPTIAQDTLNSNIVESKSLQLYNEKNYKELIKFADRAIKQNYDYYYIRMRIGIAYYERKNYMLAEKHFSKALKFDSNDEVAKEYLYYCYIYAERYDDARMLSRNFSSELAKKTGTDKKAPISFVQMEVGIKKPNRSDGYDNPQDVKITIGRPPNPPKDSVVSKADTTRFSSGNYFSVGLSHSIKNRISIFHSFSYFKQQSQHIQHKNFEFDKDITDMSGNPIHLHENADKMHEDDNLTTQLQYYVNFNIPLKKNWTVAPAFHLINNKDGHQIDSTVFEGVWPPKGNVVKYERIYTTKNFILGSVDVSKSISKIKLSFGVTYSNISYNDRVQSNLALDYFLFGNNKLIIGFDGYYLYNIDSVFSGVTLNTFVNFRPIKILSFKLNYLINSVDKNNPNNHDNAIEANGYLVDNSTDKTRSTFSASGNITFGKHVDFYLTYSYEIKKAVHPGPPEMGPKSHIETNYFYNNYFAGIRIYNFNKLKKK